MGMAEQINKLCRAGNASDHTRTHCHELHGKILAAGGNDEDVLNGVRTLLASRVALKPPPPPVRWDMPKFPDEADVEGA